ncbi:MAG: twin-arginine translocase TatA/TatE family subunit [Halobacteria archaeon]|nr:twin-arginine translocase TatA/TatE family subunit [Halobacteria archaeon]
MTVPLFVGGLGPLEIGIILLLIVVLFGADKIPKLARSAGEAKKEFEKAKIEANKEVQEYEQELEEQSAQETTEKASEESSA